MVEIASKEVKKEEEVDNNDDISNNDSNDKNPDEAEEGVKGGKEANNEPVLLTRIQRAVLRFCIALINQTIYNRKYDMAIICAAAVLEVHSTTRFRNPKSYPPILSSIIKVARFIII